MKNKIFYVLILASLTFIAGCEFDNYDPPTSSISGKVHYNGTAVGVRSNGTNLEVYQPGYALKQKINVYIAQDGTYSVRLFDGDYKITRLSGAPWEINTDTIYVTVKGNTIVDVPVSPYFTIDNPVFTYSGGAITATCNVTKVTTGTKTVSELKLYVGTKYLLDNTYNSLLSKSTTSVSLTALNTLTTAPLSATLSAREYVYVRLGLSISGIQERFYTPVVKLMLN